MSQALTGAPITVFGDGTQTRSLCYVDDLIEGVGRLLFVDYNLPVNLGNPGELTVLALAEMIRDLSHSSSEIVFKSLPIDDPRRRRPDIGLAKSLLGWEPCTRLREALARTIAWWGEGGPHARVGAPDPTPATSAMRDMR